MENQGKKQIGQELTTMLIPIDAKEECKKRGLQYKHVFMAGYNFLTKGGVEERKIFNAEMKELKEGNTRLQGKLTEISLKMHDLEQKNV